MAAPCDRGSSTTGRGHIAGTKVVIYGGSYFEELRCMYRSPTHAFAQLAPSEPKEDVDPKLMAAISALDKKLPDKAPMFSYMASAKKVPNTTEVSGIFRFCLGVKPGCKKQLPKALDACTYIARLKVHERHPGPFSVIFHWADSVLCACLTRLRKTEADDDESVPSIMIA